MPFEATVAHGPVLALEINEFATSADACRDAGADMVCLRLDRRRDGGETGSADSYTLQCCSSVARALSAGLPVAVLGTGDRHDDAQTLPEVAERFSGQRLAIGSATEDTYRPIAQACRDHGHVMIAESPIDINICKQINILATDTGLPVEQILIDPTTGGLGYGIEYTYSIMERARLAALQGDRMLSCPQICFVGAENWRLKEASPVWEAVAATALLMAGASIVVFRHPSALAMVRHNTGTLSASQETGESFDTNR